MSENQKKTPQEFHETNTECWNHAINALRELRRLNEEHEQRIKALELKISAIILV